MDPIDSIDAIGLERVVNTPPRYAIQIEPYHPLEGKVNRIKPHKSLKYYQSNLILQIHNETSTKQTADSLLAKVNASVKKCESAFTYANRS